MVGLDKTYINPVSVFRVFDLLYIQLKPYESKLSTALAERKAVARCATRKTDTAINRIKTVVTHKQSTENTSRRKQDKNHWGLQDCGHHSENRYGNKPNDGSLQNCASETTTLFFEDTP